MEYSNRKSPRIPEYDYATPNYYFITICTHNKECIFGCPGKLSVYGKIAETNLLKIPDLFPTVSIEKYVVMPNHIHGIFIVSDSEESRLKDLSVILGQYKMSVTKKIRTLEPGRVVWQRSFHDHVIRNQKSYEKYGHISKTILRNGKRTVFSCHLHNCKILGGSLTLPYSVGGVNKYVSIHR